MGRREKNWTNFLDNQEWSAKELIDLDYNYKIGKIDLNVGLETILCNNCSK